jgi:cytochrome b561
MLIARAAWRMADRPPRPEPTLAHYTLYLLLAVVPVMGIVTQFARGDALSIFGLDITSPSVKDRAFARHSI